MIKSNINLYSYATNYYIIIIMYKMLKDIWLLNWIIKLEIIKNSVHDSAHLWISLSETQVRTRHQIGNRFFKISIINRDNCGPAGQGMLMGHRMLTVRLWCWTRCPDYQSAHPNTGLWSSPWCSDIGYIV